MKADLTRSTFRQDQHFHAVRMQQGRVQLDADWNEQQDLLNHRIERETIDVVGEAAGPLGTGFELVGSGSTVEIGPGRYYVDGLLCENEQKCTLETQPDPATLTKPDPGIYLGYLEVWLRHITALEDATIREVALGGPDTCTRDQLVWQVKLLRAGDLGDSLTCFSDIAGYSALTTPPTGTLAARSLPSTPPKDPCLLNPAAGFRRLENLLYRVEIHDDGSVSGNARYKWSRDNGSIESQVVAWFGNPAKDEIELASLGRDARLSIGAGCWLELVDDTHELNGKPGALVQVLKTEGNVVTVDLLTKTDALDAAQYPNNPRVRRWEGSDKVVPAAAASPGGWVDLEDGVQAKLTPGSYRVGDFWWIPARTATADVEWPKQAGAPLFVAPHGVRRAFARLALLSFDAGVFTRLSDCRQLFPALSQLTNLFYAGGDGQEAVPNPLAPANIQLDSPLSVAVFNGEFPVKDAEVQFDTSTGDFGLAAGQSTVAKTNAAGIATVLWRVAPNVLNQTCSATLLEAGAVVPDRYTRLQFSARLSRADSVAYDPENCPDLKAQGINTVQGALDALCKQTHTGGCCTTVGEGGEFPDLQAAIDARVAEKSTAICLCLLPGEHQIAGGYEPTFAPGARFTLHGAGGASRLTLGGRFTLQGLAALSLRDFDVVVREQNGGLGLLDNQDLVLEHVNVGAVVPSPHTGLVGIGQVKRAQVSRCSISAIASVVDERFSEIAKRSRVLTLLAPAMTEAALGSSIPRELPRAILALSPPQLAQAVRELQALTDSADGPVNADEDAALDALRVAIERRVKTPSLTTALDNIRKAFASKESPGLALTFLDGEAVATIESSTIDGRLSICGESTAQALAPAALAGLVGKATIVRNASSLVLRGNQLGQIRIGDVLLELLKKLPGQDNPSLGGTFGSVVLDGNTLWSRANELCAFDAALCTNVVRDRGDLGAVVAKQGKYIGNFVHDDLRLFVGGHQPEAFGNGGLNIVVT